MPRLTETHNKNIDSEYANTKNCTILVYIFSIPEQYFEIIKRNGSLKMTTRILNIGTNSFQFLLTLICIKVLPRKHR